MSLTRTSPASFLRHAAEVSSFYGFHPMREVERLAAGKIDRIRGTHSFDTVLQVSSAAVSAHPQEPLLAFYATPTPTHEPYAHNRDHGEFGLAIVGSSDSVGEIVLLKTLAAIISEWGVGVARVRVNALGDKESQQRFARELSLYLRKHAEHLDEHCRQHAARNPTEAYHCENATCREIFTGGPRPVNFLSEKSRVHFREILEHLEKLGLPYELDDLLVGRVPEPRLMFAIDFAGEDATVLAARGGRYDEYLRRLTNKKDGYAVGANIYFRKKGAARAHFTYKSPTRAPKVFFVQLGRRAKLQGLSVLDVLREARIPVSQSFDASHLSPQLTQARSLGVSHLLIMGHREALDGTVIIRSTNDSSQTIVQLTQLPRFLKALR